jgi:3'-phosphoadenosine 5'-phosphosulfate sulfotransferase (PAPS reductase)/FAD synthetase
METTYLHWQTTKTAPTSPAPIAAQDQVAELAADGALIAISTSGGKDSLATYLAVVSLVDQGIIDRDQVVLVHADLGDVEHDGLIELIERQNTAGFPLLVTDQPKHLDGSPKDFFSMIRDRSRRLAAEGRSDVSPAPINGGRCRATGELKTAPIWSTLKRYAKAQGRDVIVSATGVRAAESARRAKDIEKHGALRICKAQTNGSWDCYDWRPVATWDINQVFTEIDQAGLELHQAYLAGNSRLSCAFCVFGNQGDLENAARAYPELAQKYINLEAEIGFPIHVSKRYLVELIDVTVETTTEDVA